MPDWVGPIEAEVEVAVDIVDGADEAVAVGAEALTPIHIAR